MEKTVVVLRVTILPLGFFSVVAIVSAIQSADTNAVNSAIGQTFASDLDLSIRSRLQSSENVSLGAVTSSSTEDADKSSSELNRELTNPVSSLWSIANQFN
jgi:hypothetical protein